MSVKDGADVVQFFRVLRQYVLVSLVDRLVDTFSALNVLEVLDELEGALRGAKLLERLFDERLGHVFDLFNLLPKALHDCVPAVFVLAVENVEGDLSASHITGRQQ